ncbi:MAG: sulfurtransferase complex subunit TusD [Aestuariibacter sp.]
MAQILVLVTSGPGESANGFSALRYCQTAVKKQHEVIVFFYSSAAHIANAFTTTASDETNLTAEFAKLKSEHNNIQLIVCNTAANRRGLLAQEEQHQLGYNIASPFHAGGLAEFAQFSQSAHRLVQF